MIGKLNEVEVWWREIGRRAPNGKGAGRGGARRRVPIADCTSGKDNNPPID